MLRAPFPVADLAADRIGNLTIRTSGGDFAGFIQEAVGTIREKAPEMRYGIRLRETTGVIRGNLIRGVEERIHVPKALAETVTIE